MKSQTLSLVKKGFTLIELIVVIAILAVLASVAYPTVMGMIGKANESSAKKTATDIVQAITSFKGDYNGFLPIDYELVSANNDGQILLSSEAGKDGRMIAALTSRESKNDEVLNTNRDVYLRSDLKEEKRDGLYSGEKGISLYDPWGSPYYIILSEESTGAIDPFTGKETGKPYIVFSLGEDKEGLPSAFNEQPSKKKSTSSSKKKQTAAQRRAAQKEAAAAAEEEFSEELEDNIYSWKTVKK